jgi:hypothetical protein
MKGGTLFYRIIPADRDRGYILLTGWAKPIVYASCYTNSSMTVPSRVSLNASLAEIQNRSGAEILVDTTEPGIVKRLAKLFGEDTPKVQAEENV